MQFVSKAHSLLISSATQICIPLRSSSFRVFTVIKACFLDENFFLWHSLSSNIPILHISNLNLKKSTVNKLAAWNAPISYHKKICKSNHKNKPATSIKGTRAFHYIKLIGATRLGMKCIRDDKQFSLKADTISPQEDIPAQNTNIEQYVSSLYDDN